MNTQILSTLTNAALQGLFAEITGEPAKRFASVSAGVKRVQAALEEKGLTVEIEDGAPVLVKLQAEEAPAFDIVGYLAPGADLPKAAAVEGFQRRDDHVRAFAVETLVTPVAIEGTAQFDAHVAAFVLAEEEAAEADREDELAAERDAEDAHDAAVAAAEADQARETSISELAAELLRKTRAPAAEAIENEPGMGAKARALAETRHARAKAANDKAKKAKGKPAAAARTDGLKPGSKLAMLADFVCRPEGATHKEACAHVGWGHCLPMLMKACQKAGITLRKEKQGAETRYFGTPAQG
ncbi:hypothetical protein [Methylobacterium nodulans]|uniref:Uncharacterized protein n=1 Tax=Methylobacterium nodulans (strain LMG 21967 / CNCM I-2342 / ORS 2060) TaxID=460265 RepID=B8IAL8_METNO|nr:hypothetical protein [Methylobacterium nodulans]ACL61063.1 hypothetical protein Mnod_6258 [Methylobacterium nodulans ORS 2060]